MYEGKNIRNTDSLERCRGDDTLDSLLKSRWIYVSKN